MSNYCVYMHISPSGKKYIGITSLKPEYRWKNGQGYKGQVFYNAIEKYGWENIEHIIVAKGLTEEEAKWLEIELIRIWDSTNSNKGYNVSLGGESSNGYHHTEETRRKISENHWDISGENNPNYGVRKYGEDNPFYGKHHTEETIKLLSEKAMGKGLGKSNPNAKSVICLTTMEIFDTLREGAKKYNCTESNITQCCKNNERNYCGKLSDGTPLVWVYYKDYLNMTEEEIQRKLIKANKQINKIICITTNEIFDTAKEGAKKYNIGTSGIYHCCKGYRIKNGKKYNINYCGKLEDGTKLVWKYLVDYLEEQEK